MAKVEIPGIPGRPRPEDLSPPPAVAQPEPEPRATEEEPVGTPLEDDLDPILAQAVASQPELPPAPPPDEAKPASAPAARTAAGSPSFPAPRRRALGGFLAAGALALAGIAATAVLGGKRNGSATGVHASPRPEATGASGGVLGAAALDGSEAELARLFGLDPGG